MTKLLIRNAQIFDGLGHSLQLNKSILIQDGRIKSITSADEGVPPEATLIDATGKSVLPGLIDMHAHLLSGGFDTITEVIDSFEPATQERALKQMLYWGITSVYSPVQPLQSGLELRARTSNGATSFPRLFISGPGFTAPNGWAGSLLPLARFEPKTLEEAEQHVNQLADAGVDILKIYYDTQCCAFLNPLPKLELPIMERIIAQAHARNLRVMLHAYDTQFQIDALRAGVDIMAHSAVTDPIDDEYLELASKAKTLYLATLSVYQDAFDEGSLRKYAAEEFVQRTVPKKTLDTLVEEGPLDEFLKITKKSYLKDQLPTIKSNLKRVSDSGIPVGVGPDTGVMGAFPGLSVHREMELMVDAGMSPAQVLVAATRTAAEYLGEQSLGTIESGKIADLVLVNGNPLEDISHTRAIDVVIKNGQIIDREKLLKEILAD
ncbi:MAG TPA: amidohydrolase family protein [Pyrinomonadaceae bacterium]|nr:amidohydrolase family protein [Pyrinomonadaceae bacterium]